MTADERSDWQRRYDESLERERLRQEERGGVTTGEQVALDSPSCAPGWLGLAGAVLVGAIVMLRRRQRRRS